MAMIKGLAIGTALCAFLIPSYIMIEKTDNNSFSVYINEQYVGDVDNEQKIDECLIQARRELVSGENDLVLMDINVRTEGKNQLFGRLTDSRTLIDAMKEQMRQSVKETLKRSYTVKINECTVNLGSSEEVHTLLKAALDTYDESKKYDVELVVDSNRELNVLTTEIKDAGELSGEMEVIRTEAGMEAAFTDMLADVESAREKDFSDYPEGIMSIAYADKIEVVEAYLLEEELMPVEEAINLVTQLQETQQIYEVKSGDTLSQISIDNNIPMDELVEINDALESENTMIRVGQELVITVPEPELSVIRQEQCIYTEDYEAEVQYIPNDDWYTTQKVTLQDPSAGRRKVVAMVTYNNDAEVSRDIVMEEVYAEAVPKIVERGTKIPPTYVKPISGGRLSSGFGGRKAPTKGASTYHKGVDWATPTGTPVYASNAGTVVQAGWSSGYGYAVYINHADGRQTRYGHLSKVLVSAGQTVSQGQKIALSGNTGRSTGPHLHFEIRINGQAVNPLSYLN